MIRHSKSLELVWRIAELEALNLNQEMLKPAHFLLGILKVVEVDLSEILENQREEISEEIENDIADLKSCVGEFVVEITYARRFLRGILPRGDKHPSRERLQRSKSARMVFRDAETSATKTRSPVLPTHLLMALLESQEAQIIAALEKVHVDIGDFKKFVSSFISNSRKLPQTS
jgi:ATP-dependent Clp protease ATP-binding subunit ClpA